MHQHVQYNVQEQQQKAYCKDLKNIASSSTIHAGDTSAMCYALI